MPACWGRDPSLGARVLPFLSAHPAVHSHGLWVPAQVLAGGGGRRAESSPRGSPAPPKQMGASRAHDKYQQHEAPASPLRVSPESGGRGWRGQPSCPGLVLVGRTSGWAGHIPRRMAEEAGGRPVTSPAVDCPVRPAVGERKRERESPSASGSEGGVAGDMRGGVWRSCGLVLEGGLPPVPGPCPRLPGHPDTARARPLSLAGVQAAGQSALTSCLPLGEQGPQREGTGLWGSKQGCKALLEQRGLRVGRGAFECPWSPPRATPCHWPRPNEPRVSSAHSSRERSGVHLQAFTTEGHTP